MRFLVHGDQLPVVEVRVLLRRRERDVAEELLDAAEVGAGVEEMRSERVAHRVRRNAGAQRRFANVAVEEPPYASRRDPLSAIVDEERRLLDVGDERAANREPRADRLLRLRSERHDPLLRSFAAYFHQSRAKLDIIDVDSDKFADAQSRRVEHFEKRAVANAE